jgi:hypothetical protein
VLDAQVWSRLALGSADFEPYQAALESAWPMRSEQGGYPFHAANTNGGGAGGHGFHRADPAAGRHERRSRIRADAWRLFNSRGRIPGGDRGGAQHRFRPIHRDPWTYKDIPHIAPAAWYVLAVNNFNPYAF